MMRFMKFLNRVIDGEKQFLSKSGDCRWDYPMKIAGRNQSPVYIEQNIMLIN